MYCTARECTSYLQALLVQLRVCYSSYRVRELREIQHPKQLSSNKVTARSEGACPARQLLSRCHRSDIQRQQLTPAQENSRATTRCSGACENGAELSHRELTVEYFESDTLTLSLLRRAISESSPVNAQLRRLKLRRSRVAMSWALCDTMSFHAQYNSVLLRTDLCSIASGSSYYKNDNIILIEMLQAYRCVHTHLGESDTLREKS